MGIPQAMNFLKDRAAFVKDSLHRSQTITDNMVAILGSFDHRLSALETAMRPTQVHFTLPLLFFFLQQSTGGGVEALYGMLIINLWFPRSRQCLEMCISLSGKAIGGTLISYCSSSFVNPCFLFIFFFVWSQDDLADDMSWIKSS